MQRTSIIDAYFQRFGFCERQIQTPPRSDLGIVVVIPCFNEPDLIGSLGSLWECERPACSVEVIVVINAASNSPREIHLQNQNTFTEASEWIAQHQDSRFAYHLLRLSKLPDRQAGAGLARKIGMDEALRRLSDVNCPEGIIVCYDADCRCDSNYLSGIERHFRQHLRSPACSICFEHPLSGPFDQKVYEAIAAYELHLRYYVQALRYSGFPYAYQTIGSCMAVRAEAYRKQGGMNKRQAGEDFYFLHKVIPLGGFTELTGTKVIPSPRPSDRVPFGTGKAVRDFLADGRITTYPLSAFLDLKRWFDRISSFYRETDLTSSRVFDGLPETVRTFWSSDRFAEIIQEIQENTSTDAAFRKRLFHWLNAFTVMKFIHHARDHFYGDGVIEREPGRLLELLIGQTSGTSLVEILQTYRQLDRERSLQSVNTS
ncbi:MAG: glycosyltransferase [Verrucomicrobia bacterium]|nr:glycosyltransferase [Verrucomicrobiota bacterium]